MAIGYHGLFILGRDGFTVSDREKGHKLVREIREKIRAIRVDVLDHSQADTPEINGETNVNVGDILDVTIEHSDEHDLWGAVERVE